MHFPCSCLGACSEHFPSSKESKQFQHSRCSSAHMILHEPLIRRGQSARGGREAFSAFGLRSACPPRQVAAAHALPRPSGAPLTPKATGDLRKDLEPAPPCEPSGPRGRASPGLVYRAFSDDVMTAIALNGFLPEHRIHEMPTGDNTSR